MYNRTSAERLRAPATPTYTYSTLWYKLLTVVCVCLFRNFNMISVSGRFNQTVDHYGFTTEAKFHQKYLYNDEWYENKDQFIKYSWKVTDQCKLHSFPKFVCATFTIIFATLI